MDATYNSYFFNDFYAENGGGNYLDKEQWSPFFDNVAKQIVANYSPKTVLDAGCATGYLVSSLRKLGVEAWGIDISEYAISKGDEAVKNYLAVASITDPLPDNFPKKFDLIITIEVLEHLMPEAGAKAIANLCSYSDSIIFTSTPDDIEDRTHCNVQQPEYWTKRFAENGFYHDLIQRVDFICSYAMLFRKKEAFPDVVFDYELNRRIDNLKFSKIIAELKHSEITENATVYFEVNGNFDPDTSITVPYQNGFLKTERISVPAGCKHIRFDPIDNNFAIVSKLSVISNIGQLTAEADNSYYKDSSAAFFDNADPQYIFTCPSGVSWMEISCHVSAIKDSVGYAPVKDLATGSIELTNEIAALKVSSKEKIQTLEKSIQIFEEKQKSKEAALTKAESELAHYKKHYFAAIEQREDFKNQLAHVSMQYNTVVNAASWKITAPLRKLLDLIKRILKKNKFTYLLCKGLKSIKNDGFKATLKKVKNKRKQKKQLRGMKKNYYALSEKEKNLQLKTKFDKNIKFSILVPLYNTPIDFLVEMIKSVQNQTYKTWELCLADGSDTQHKNVEKAVNSFASKDSRIKYKKLEKNLGISENTNACIEMASGDYIALFDHDDILHPSALFEVMKAICEKDADMIYTDENTFSTKPEDAYCPHFKPDYSPDTLRSYNYICHLTVFKASLLEEIGGGFRKEYDGSQDYDMILRLTEKAKNIVHIPKILYFWRAHKNSVASDISAKPYTLTAAKAALSAHLDRQGLEGEAKNSSLLSSYKIQYKIKGNPLISIIIPNKDHVDVLEQCLNSIYKLSTYRNFEIIIVENNSTEQKTFEYYEKIKVVYNNLKVVVWENEFNYSKINNFGFKFAAGEHILLLNNDIEIITPDWLEQMLMFSQRDDIGAVGAMLYYPDNTIQHAGVILGIGGIAGHSHKYFNRGDTGYSFRLTIAQNLSAVTAACLMMRSEIFKEIGGLDEKFAVAFNDVDMCMRIRKAGYKIVWTPYAEAYHHESKSRGQEDTPEKQMRFKSEIDRFYSIWSSELDAGDPYYNKNLTLEREDFSIK